MNERNDHLRKAYLEGHKACGLKIGDKVKVVRKVNDFEQGWDNVWNSNMKLGTYVIARDGKEKGFGMRNDYNYPWFVLEKVEDAKLDILDGLDFGGQTEHVRKLIERLDARYGYKQERE